MESGGDILCSSFDYCPKNPTLKKQDITVVDKSHLEDPSLNECSYCELFFSYFATDGLKSFAIPAGKEIVERVCPALMPDKKFCDDIKENKVEKIIEMIILHYNPSKACKTAELC